MFYDGNHQNPEKKEAEPLPKETPEETTKSGSPSHLKLVVASEQLGLTNVMMDFKEKQKKQESPAPSAGLTTRYNNDSSPAKGVLLNRKAE